MRSPHSRKPGHCYIQLTEVEDAFHTGKGDPGFRLVYHPKQDQVEVHIFICYLSPFMRRSLEMWLKAKSLGNCPRQAVKELGTIHSMDVVVPVRDQTPPT